MFVCGHSDRVMKCQKTHKLTKEDKVKGDKDSVSKRSKRERERREGGGMAMGGRV